MADLDSFLKRVKAAFPDDRLTWQKGIATFHPEHTEDAAAFLKLANEQGQQLFITGFGNNLDPIGEHFERLVTIRTDRLNRDWDLAGQDFALTVGSGFPLREINRRLKRHDLYLPHSALPYVGSVGGALAVNLRAELHGHDVPLKKYFIKAEIVTPAGEIITPGSSCFKSVSGYDIVKLFAGSWGLLGLIVRATFRVMPISGADDFATLTQNEVKRESMLDALAATNNAADAVYSRKIKAKFDPANILPNLL